MSRVTLNPINPINGEIAVYALALSRSSLYVGGDFDYNLTSGASTDYLIKLDATTGALDDAFSQASGLDGPVTALDLETDGLHVGGVFSQYRGGVTSDSVVLEPGSGKNVDASPF